MTPGTPVAVRRSVASRVLAGGWSTGLFLLGALFDIMAVMNVPGSAGFTAHGVKMTDAGAGWCLLAVALWVSVYFRRRAPLVPLIAGAVLLVVGTSYLLFFVGVFEVLRSRRSRARLIGGIAICGVALYLVRDLAGPWGGGLQYVLTTTWPPREGLPWGIAAVVIAVLALAATFLLAAYARSRGEADDTRRRAEREKRRADSLSEELVRKEERERIARDMHDTLAYSLGRVNMQAGALEARAEGADPELAGRARTVQELVRSAMGDLRAVLGDLRGSGEPELASGAPLSMRALGGLLGELRRGGVAIDAYVLVDDVDRALPALDAAVFRIVQESLTNAMKHAPGTPISVYLEASAASGVRIRVSNPLTATLGVPAATGAVGAGHGTVGIRERAAAVGGTVWIGEHQGLFIVDATLPWAERERASG